ncbi:hypothetical protein DSO57_1032959 [Entomophthora muscae]|uniref:Uncharacterized protein n=1 Tax=Entomophthora muscae TaxID=34485 RepID=A0ACC2TC80_9FUNG|nr:hypothetical protein DSO57_1032959 [Entomophthora muscae]
MLGSYPRRETHQDAIQCKTVVAAQTGSRKTKQVTTEGSSHSVSSEPYQQQENLLIKVASDNRIWRLEVQIITGEAYEQILISEEKGIVIIRKII